MKIFDEIFEFSNLNKNHEIFCNKNRKVISKIKIETPKNILIGEFNCLRSKMYAFKCGIASKIKLKGGCKFHSKIIKFEAYENCLDGNDYQQECDK